MKEGTALAVAFATIILLFVGTAVGCSACAGDGSYGFGADKHTVEATVTSKHVDVSGGESSSTNYMVSTDAGTFEIDNGFIMGIWNADELYGQLETGKRYKFTIQGDTTAAWWTQTYPYVVAIEQVAQ